MHTRTHIHILIHTYIREQEQWLDSCIQLISGLVGQKQQSEEPSKDTARGVAESNGVYTHVDGHDDTDRRTDSDIEREREIEREKERERRREKEREREREREREKARGRMGERPAMEGLYVGALPSPSVRGMADTMNVQRMYTAGA